MPRKLSNPNYIRTVFFLAICAAFSLWTQAGTILVTSPADSGPGSLRQAVADAMLGDSIVFSPEITRVVLSGGEIVIAKDLDIRGPSVPSPEDQLVIAAGGTSRLFRVTRPAGGTMPVVGFKDLALTGGAVAEGNGGAIYNEGRITLQRCSIHGNSASAGPGGGGNGGGIYNTGILRVEASTLYGNKAFGVSGHGDTGNGGGIYNGWGGADTVVPRVLLVNSTVSGNEALLSSSATSWSGVSPQAVWALAERSGLGGGSSTTRARRVARGGVEAVPGLIEAEHCTIAFNKAASGGGVASFLLMKSATSGPDEAIGGAAFILQQHLEREPRLGRRRGSRPPGRRHRARLHRSEHPRESGREPQRDGTRRRPPATRTQRGPTLTHGLQPWSPAVNAESGVSGLTFDQTGAARTAAGRADSGAWEFPIEAMPLGRGLAAVFQDRDGEAVRVVLTGPGDGYATAMAGADAVDIVLKDTTGATELDIETSGQTSVRSVLVQGRLKALRAERRPPRRSDRHGRRQDAGPPRPPGPRRDHAGKRARQGSSLQFRKVRDCALRCEGKIRKVAAEEWDGAGDGAHDLCRHRGSASYLSENGPASSGSFPRGH